MAGHPGVAGFRQSAEVDRDLLLTRTWWWPGQCRSIDVEWDQRSWDQDEAGQDEPEVGGSPARGGRVEPGSYRFEVRWRVSSGGEPDEHLPAPVETAPFVPEP